MNSLSAFWADDSGATMIEYAVMLAMIAVVCFAAVQLFGEAVKSKFVEPELVDGLS